MTRSSLRTSIACLGMVLSACNDDNDLDSYVGLDAGAVVSDASGDALANGPLPSGPDFAPVPPGCAPFGESVPRTLSCTGLYGEAGTAPADKVVHPSNRSFAPGVSLWTDGADKQRWIAFPPTGQVDTSDANGWVAPEGTRVWKEFAFQGRRVETRLMYKRDGTWNFATYQWNDAQTDATFVDGAQVPLANGQVHSIPKMDQCNECHRGARDKLLGFQQVLLGLPGAKGLDLATLAAEHRLTKPPAVTRHVIPDDGTTVAPEALGWLHVNCGVSCHNETGNAQANMSRMFLRIDPSQVNAATPSDWNMIKLTVGVPSMTANFSGGIRIVAGKPDQSVLIQLAQTRGTNTAMPPIGTNVVDQAGLAVVKQWITRLGSAPDAGLALDGSVPDAGDAGIAVDASTLDAEVPDAEANDAEANDAEVVDAEVVLDAEVPVPEVPVPEVPVPEVPVPEVPVPEVPVPEVPVPEVPDAGGAELIDAGVVDLADAEVPPVPETPVGT